MHFFKSIAIASAISAGLLAQNSPTPPVQAKRLPPEKPKGKPSGANDNLIDRYDFGAQTHAQNVIEGKVNGLPKLTHLSLGRRKVVRKEWLEQWMEANKTR